MEVSVKTILGVFEPFFAFVATITLFNGITIYRSTEDGIRIFMATLFAIYYIIKILRLIGMKDEVLDIEKRVKRLEELEKRR
jgi:hypothetical protein